MRFIAVVEKRRAALVLVAPVLVLFGARAALLGYAASLGLGAILLAIVGASGAPTASKARAASAADPRGRPDEFS